MTLGSIVWPARIYKPIKAALGTIKERPHHTSMKLLSFLAWQKRYISELQAKTLKHGMSIEIGSPAAGSKDCKA